MEETAKKKKTNRALRTIGLSIRLSPLEIDQLNEFKAYLEKALGVRISLTQTMLFALRDAMQRRDLKWNL